MNKRLPVHLVHTSKSSTRYTTLLRTRVIYTRYVQSCTYTYLHVACVWSTAVARFRSDERATHHLKPVGHHQITSRRRPPLEKYPLHRRFFETPSGFCEPSIINLYNRFFVSLSRQPIFYLLHQNELVNIVNKTVSISVSVGFPR